MKTVVGVFAHPDDEAFGPGGTLAQLSQDHEVYIICVTNGDAKNKNVEEQQKLGKIRRKELEASCKILGIKKVFFLGYPDGSLCHNVYHEVADKIQKHLEGLQPEMLITFEKRGVSGHIDHIFVSMVTSYVFEKLSFVQTLLYYCNSEELRKLVQTYFIHMPLGYKKSEIQKIVDTQNMWETKVKAMQIHKSQWSDVEKVLSWQKQLPKEEYFLVVEK